MSEKGPEKDGTSEAIVERRRRGISPIWVIPIVAALVAATLAYEAIQSRGLKVIVVFESAEGLVAGKSKVKYRQVEIGTVDLVRIRDLEHVEVHCSLDQRARSHLTESARWWVVRPRVGRGGISGLGTLLTGAYLTFQPGKEGDKKQREFVGLEEPPLETPVGLTLMLETGSLGGVALGDPIYYRGLTVGSVLSHALSKDGSKVRIRVNVEPLYAHLVRSNSVFWNAGGITADLGLRGLHVHAESLSALVAGGVAFATPPKPGHAVSGGSVFRLHPEPKDDWTKWETDFASKDGDEPEKHGLGRFFHHEGKSQEQAQQDDVEAGQSERHGLRKLFHLGR